MDAGIIVCQVIGFLLQTVPCSSLLFQAVPISCMTRSYRECMQRYLIMLGGLSLIFTDSQYILFSTGLWKYMQLLGDTYMLITVILILVSTRDCFQMEWKKRLILILLVMQYEAVIVSVNSAVMDWVPSKTNDFVFYPQNVSVLFFLSVLLYPFMKFLMTRVVRKNILHLKGVVLEHGCVYVILSIIGYLCIATMVNLHSTMYNLFFQLVILISNVVTYVVFFSEIGIEKRRTQLEEQMNMVGVRYEMMKENIELTRKTRHDMRHQLNGLRTLYEKGDWEKMGEFLQVNGKILEQLEKNENISQSPVFDSLFRYYHSYAVSRGIPVHMNIHISSDYSFSPVDMTNLVGNGMENAIEATESMPMEKRYIQVDAMDKDQKLLIQIKNSCELQKNHNQQSFLTWEAFPSMKREYSSHGYGLKSMDEIAKKYGGMLNLKQSNEEFITRIVLEIP